MNPKNRKPIDNRPMSEQYQFTQGDAIISREQQKEIKQKQQKRLQRWGGSLLFILGLVALYNLLA